MPTDRRGSSVNQSNRKHQTLRMSKGTKAAAGPGIRRAVVVGINNYGSDVNNLPSCLKDADDFSTLLSSDYQFEVTKLLDEAASKKAVVDALNSAFVDLTSDDRVVFYYSGHGYRVPQNRVLEDCLVLQDLQFLLGSELAEMTQQLPPGILTVVLDSCFSGGMDKLFQAVVSESTGEPVRIKSYTPNVDKLFEHAQLEGQLQAIRTFGGSMVTIPSNVALPFAKSLTLLASSAAPTQLKGLLTAACQANETAAASTSQTSGNSAFTYCLTKLIASDGTLIPSSRILDQARTLLASLKVSQTPLIKEPAEPPNLSAKSFLTLSDVNHTAKLLGDLVGLYSSRASQGSLHSGIVDPMLSSYPTQTTITHGGVMPEAGDVISILSQLSKGYQQPQRKDIDPAALVQAIGQLVQVFKAFQPSQVQNKVLSWPDLSPPVFSPDVLSAMQSQNKSFDPVAAIQTAAQIAQMFKGFQPAPTQNSVVQNKDFWNAVAAAIPVIVAVAA
jgi:hypothetical protein